MSGDPRRQDLTLSRGVPFTETLYIAGDQTGKTIAFRAAERGSADEATPTVDAALAVGAYDTATDTTPATLSLPSATVDNFAAGPVYVYRVQIENGPPIAWGELHAVPKWEAER